MQLDNPKLLSLTDAVAWRDRLRAAGRKESDEAVAAMEKRGLKVTKPTPEDNADWVKFMEEFYPNIRGHLVPAEMFDEVVKLVKEYRAKAK
mgnify:CR=1 FL=1